MRRRDSLESDGLCMSPDEVAAVLSLDEGRTVTRLEVLRIEAQSLRKLRREVTRRGLKWEDVYLGFMHYRQVMPW